MINNFSFSLCSISLATGESLNTCNEDRKYLKIYFKKDYFNFLQYQCKHNLVN